MELATICFHHNDLDGILAGHIVSRYYPEATMIPINYSGHWKEEDIKGKRVVVVDFAFDDMAALRDKCAELIWCDHHKTPKDKQRKAWNDPAITGYRSLDYAGCMLTYAFFNGIHLDDLPTMIKNDVVPYVVKAIAIHDMWQHEMSDEVDTFCATAFLKLTAPDSVDFKRFFGEDHVELEREYIATGEVLIQAALHRVRHVASREEVTILKTPSGNITLMVVNSTSDISMLGAIINTEAGCDIAAIFEVIRERHGNHKHDICKVSLRSQKFNISFVAEAMGGGGHPGAAGFISDESPAQMRDTLQSTIYRVHEMLGRR